MPVCCGLCVYDGNGIATYVNRTLPEVGELSDFVGHPVWKDCVEERAVRADFAECMLTGRAIEVMSHVKARNGSTPAFRFEFHPLPPSREHRVACVWHPPTFGPELSTQELECVRLLADGLRQDEIAERLFVCESTVKSAIGRAKAKLGAKTSAQLTYLAGHHGLV